MGKSQPEVTIYRKKRSLLQDKAFVRQLNLLLFFVIILLSTILLSRIHVPTVKSASGTENLPLIDQTKQSQQAQILGVTNFRLPILMYHYVENVTDLNDTFRMSMNITPDIFEKQILTLKNDGFIFLTMAETAEILDQARELPEKAVVLTFDDGYRDFYDVVYPLLQKHQIKAVAYISPGLLDSPNYMNTQHVQEIAQSGLVEIASHTVNHVNMQGASIPVAYYEIYESKHQLEELIGIPVVSFAYPYGGFDDQAALFVKQAGYKTSVTTIPGIEVTEEKKYTLERLRPGMRADSELLNYFKQNSFVPY